MWPPCIDPDVLGLDGDAPLALDVHRVEVLLAHVPGVDGAGQLEDAVRQGRLAVVDVADDGEVADAVDRDGSGRGCGRRHGPSIVPAQVGAPGRLAREHGAGPAGPALAEWARHLLQLSSAPVGLAPAAGPLSRTPRILTWPTSRARSSATARTRSAACATSRCAPSCARAPRPPSRPSRAAPRTAPRLLRLAVKRIDKAAAQGVIHKNQAANRKSRLVRRIAAIEAGRRVGGAGSPRRLRRRRTSPGCASTPSMWKVNIFSGTMRAPTASARRATPRTPAPAWAGTRRAWPDAARRTPGRRASKNSARPCTVTASSSPGRWVALTAGPPAR